MDDKAKAHRDKLANSQAEYKSYLYYSAWNDFSAGFDAGYAYQEERLKIAERALRLVQKHGLFHYEDCKNSNYEDEQCTCGMERAEFEVKEALEKLGVK